MKLTRYLVLVCLLCPIFAYAQRPLTIVGGVVTANVADTNDFQVTLMANVTGVTLTSTTGSANTPVTPATGYQITMRFVQDATGSRTVVFGGSISTSCSVNATANSVTICRWQYTASTNAWTDAGGSSVSPVLGVNIKLAPYNAVGDGKVFWDGVTNAGNNQLTSATAIFAATDVAHNISCVNAPASGSAASALNTTITSFVNATTVVYGGANAGNKTLMACKVTNPIDSTAIAAAFMACKTSNILVGSQTPLSGLGCNLYAPAGIYGVNATIDNLIVSGNEACVGIVGDGFNKTVLVPEATFTYTNHPGWFINDRCGGAYLHDFAVTDVSTPRNLGGVPTGMVVTTGTNVDLRNVAVYDQCNTNGANIYAIDSDGGSNLVWDRPQAVNNGNCSGGNGGAQVNGVSSMDIYSPFLSNTKQNLNVVNQLSGSTGSGLRIWGGVIDEGSVTFITNSVDVWLNGVTLTGGANCLSVGATSSVWMSGGYCGTFGGNTGSGPTVASGGKLRMTEVSVNGVNAGSYCYNSVAAGGILDLGGNNCTVSGGATIYNAGSFGLTFPLTTDSITQLGGRQTVAGTAPTFAVTGFGTSPTITVQTGSTDAAGAAIITAGTTPGSSGTFTLTFTTVSGAYGTNKPVCTFTLIDGTGAWNALAQEPRAVDASTSTTSILANWNDNSVALTAGSTYGFNWSCYGK